VDAQAILLAMNEVAQSNHSSFLVLCLQLPVDIMDDFASVDRLYQRYFESSFRRVTKSRWAGSLLAVLGSERSGEGSPDSDNSKLTSFIQ
jgi:hypothetical protein